MKRVVTSVAVLLAVIALMLRNRAGRRAQPCPPTSARNEPEFKGHPWFATTYDVVSRWSEPEFLRRFRSLVAGEAIGRVLEIGVGTGANFPYYQRAGQIVAVEPDPFMLGRAKPKPRWNLHGIPASLCESHLGLGIEGLRRVVDTPLDISNLPLHTRGMRCLRRIPAASNGEPVQRAWVVYCNGTQPTYPHGSVTSIQFQPSPLAV